MMSRPGRPVLVGADGAASSSAAVPPVRPGGGDVVTGPAPGATAGSRPAAPDRPKLLRLGAMIKKTLDEIHAMPLDEQARRRLVRTHRRAVAELDAALPADLRTELDALAPPLPTGTAVSDTELRIAQAQLVGWLEGVFEAAFTMAVHDAALARTRS